MAALGSGVTRSVAGGRHVSRDEAPRPRRPSQRPAPRPQRQRQADAVANQRQPRLPGPASGVVRRATRAIYRKAGGYARIATLAKQIREETKGRVLFLDNGDTFHGTYPVVQSRGEVLVPIMNQLRPDAMTVHWDFAYGPASPARSWLQGLTIPSLPPISTRKERAGAFCAPYAMREVGWLKIGIIGIASNISRQDHAAALQRRSAVH